MPLTFVEQNSLQNAFMYTILFDGQCSHERDPRSDLSTLIGSHPKMCSLTPSFGSFYENALSLILFFF